MSVGNEWGCPDASPELLSTEDLLPLPTKAHAFQAHMDRQILDNLKQTVDGEYVKKSWWM